MPSIDFTDDELQQLIQIVATGSGPGINWLSTNSLLSKFQQAAALAKPQQTIPREGGEPLYTAIDRPLEPPHRRRANSEDR